MMRLHHPNVSKDILLYLLFMDIDTSTKAGSIPRDYPELTDWFMDMGLCGCGNDSSMMWTLERLAKEKNMDITALLDDI